MNQRGAFRDTLRLADRHGMPELPGSDLGLAHLQEMAAKVECSDFSEAKLGRWLGWAQCALVAANVGVSLADMKELNAKWADNEAPAAEYAVVVNDADGSQHRVSKVFDSPAAANDERRWMLGDDYFRDRHPFVGVRNASRWLPVTPSTAARSRV